MPRFVQDGESLIIKKTQQYIVVHITRLEVFDAVADMGDPLIWATLEWGGITRESRRIKRPQLFETFYFRVGISEQDIEKTKNKNDLAELIMEELKSSPEIHVNVWADGQNGIIQFIGMCRVSLNEIKDAAFVDRSFIDGDSKAKVTF